jgi:predicted glycosyltransferase
MDIEKRLNFRSAFNIVPERYLIPPSVRQILIASGFEVGVHGLKHDGKLFKNRTIFESRAQRINGYLKEWSAAGFTAPSMLRNLNWIAELDIEYGCSTFDTDPFEPHPEGMHTIFPFQVSNTAKTKTYIELPYTLPQDHGLYIILKEKDNRIWKEKIDWIAKNGGMVLLNTHPDYMDFGGMPFSSERYPVSHYVEFLDYVKTRYMGHYWHVLPRELARFWRSARLKDNNHVGPGLQNSKPQIRNKRAQQGQTARTTRARIWIDLDNTPHVPFFMPIIRELERRGHKVAITARDAFQVCELADEKGIPYVKIGRHYGKNPVMKIIGLLWRATQMVPFYLRQRPDLALSHGSRSQILLCNLLRIPTVLIVDYEYSQTIPLAHPRWTIIPDYVSGNLPRENVMMKPRQAKRIRHFRGIKEDVYVPEFRPDLSLLDVLGIRKDEMVVTVRPPADEAHYHTPESDVLFIELMSRVCKTAKTRAILLPRNLRQELDLRASHPEWFFGEKTVVPPQAVNGLDLIWLSDFVVSGGGTMNREAAAMGITVYSIFRGKAGAVDKKLEQEGRLVIIQNAEDVWTKIQFVYRDKQLLPDTGFRPALLDIVGHIEDIIRSEFASSPMKGKIGLG